MKVTALRISNFQCFGPKPTTIELVNLTYVLGPNGAGKTAVLEALSRLFSPLSGQRRIRFSDFHTPVGQSPSDVQAGEPVLWIEVDIEIPEFADDGVHASVPPNFGHMRIESADGTPQIRVRLTAKLALDGFIDEKIEYVLEADARGEPMRSAEMHRYDRGHIEVYYLPARRDPADHISYTTASLLGRSLRAADWTNERAAINELSTKITQTIVSNDAVNSIGIRLTGEWSGLHRGAYFKDPSIAFGRGELEGILRQITVTFSPSHEGVPLPFERLSDGQKSLLYISLVLAWQALARRVLNREEIGLDAERLRPPVHTIIALEEPENSLAPQYLGRIVGQLRKACDIGDVQALIATHAPGMVRRVHPHTIRFLRLDTSRQTTVKRVVLPDDDKLAAKYVREAVEAFPELYFSRLVVLGEGDSEQIVLPRIFAAAGIVEDDASVTVTPLGGRHVNHFWRLLNELEIPHATLIDLDASRYEGGWGRVRNAMKQINVVRPGTFDEDKIGRSPKWGDDVAFPKFQAGNGALAELEKQGVFFAHPVDLDLMMMAAYPDAYDVAPSDPDDKTIVAVLGKAHKNEKRLPTNVRKLFSDYHQKFDLGSKPVAHLGAMADLSDEQLLEQLPDVLERLVQYVRTRLAELPE
ncbi:recombination protein F [Mycobacteroides abscessus subsp. bolletii]|uniref:ATP-dependent nuclease n=1 Tax=Mycobacteroides abscessus TaxID=36809 RepID=UPI0009A7A354|nr:AAA family ATPase [Mycobacteroides abscessus]SKK56212.1 recombination protein F [Mycobacteroides abscessus subsp. bolletii]